jgi:hypothetical protein
VRCHAKLDDKAAGIVEGFIFPVFVQTHLDCPSIRACFTGCLIALPAGTPLSILKFLISNTFNELKQ